MSGLRAAVSQQWRQHPVLIAVCIGLVLRTVAALSGFGWFAADDYYYVVEPAWRWLEEPELAYSSRIRSPLFARFFSVLLAVGHALAEDPRWILRISYLGLGLLSLGVIPGVYALTRNRVAPAAATAALLAAAHALMPRLATRALIEVGAMLPLVWGLVFVDASVRGSARRRFVNALAGGVLFALAAMVRFQVGVIGVGILAWMLWRVVRRPSEESALVAWAPVAGLMVAGVLGVVMQSLVDVVGSDRPAFASVTAYVGMNLERSSQFGESPWYTYALHLLALTVPPTTLVLARPLWRACRQHALVSISLAVFVLAHTLVPHKEDRFLFPILPLALVLLATALVELRDGGRWQRRALAWFWGVNLVALPFACLSDGQRSMTVPLLELRENAGVHDIAVVGARRVPRFYLGRRHRAHPFRNMRRFLAAVADGAIEVDFVLARPAPGPEATAALAAAGMRCGEPRVFRGDWVDRALLVLNPRRNKRRRPVGLLDCR